MSRPTIDIYTRQRMADAIATIEFEQGMRWPPEVKIRFETARVAMIRAGKMIYAVEELLAGLFSSRYLAIKKLAPVDDCELLEKSLPGMPGGWFVVNMERGRVPVGARPVI